MAKQQYVLIDGVWVATGGPPGAAGDPGPEGDQGPKGDTGSTGPQGIPGVKGDKGDKGDPGSQGLTGATGSAGPKGAQGEVSVVDTFTGAPGTNVIITDSNPSPNIAALAFTIPRGDKGDQGIQGIPGTSTDINKGMADALYEGRSDLLKEAAWYVDAGALGTGGDRLKDLTGRGRDAIFGAAAAAPVVLPWTGEDYIFMPGDTNTITAAGATNTPTDIFEMEWEGIVTDLGGASAFWAVQRFGAQIYINPSAQVYLTAPAGYTAANIGPSAATQLILGQRHKIRAVHDYNTNTSTLYLDGVSVGSAVRAGTPTFGGVGSVTINQGVAARLQSRRVYRVKATVNSAVTHELDPRNVSADYSTIANTGSAGGNWTITRAATGYKTAVVDRPLLLFGASAQYAMATNAVPISSGTVLLAARYFTTTADQSMWRGGATITQGGSRIYAVANTANLKVDANSATGVVIPPGSVIGHFGASVSGLTVTSAKLDTFYDGAKTGSTATTGQLLVNDRFIIGHNTGSAMFEFVSAAIFDRALTDAEIAQVSLELQGISHVKQPDPHPQYALDTDLSTSVVTERNKSNAFYEGKSDLLKESAWWVDAGMLGSTGDRLLDLTGRSRDAIFGAAAAAPVVLPWTGEDYMYKPVTATGDNYVKYLPPGNILATTRLTLVMDVSVLSYNTGTYQNLFYSGTGASGITIYLNTAGALRISQNGAANVTTYKVPLNTRVRLGFDWDGTTMLFSENGVVKETVALATTGHTGIIYGMVGDLTTSNTTGGLRIYGATLNIDNEVAPRVALDLSKVSADYTTITNTGSLGGNWTINRGATGYKTAVVDRPLLLFGGGQNANTVSSPPPGPSERTTLIAARMFGTSSTTEQAFWDMEDTSAPYTGGFYFYRPSSGAYVNAQAWGPAGSDTRPSSVFSGASVFGARLSSSQFTAFPGGSVASRANGVAFSGGPIRIGNATGTGGLFEFVAAATWDRALTDAEIAQVSQELAGVPHVKQPDPHPQYALEATVGNLLTENQASGTDTLGDTTGWLTLGAGTVISSSTALAFQGTRALRIVTTGSATFQGAKTTPGIALLAGQPYTASVRVRATVAGLYRIALLGTGFATAITYATLVADTWTTISVTGTPAAAVADATVQIDTATIAKAATIDTDQWGLWRGAGMTSDWAMPGTPITGTQSSMEQVTLLADLPSTGNWLGRRIQVTSGLGFQVMLWSGTAWTVDPASDTGWLTLPTPSGWTPVGLGFRVRRQGSRASGQVRASATAGATGTIWTPTAGFAPDAVFGAFGALMNSSTTTVPITNTSTQVAWFIPVAPTATSYAGEFTYNTVQNWPTTAP